MIIMSNLYTENSVKMTVIINIKYVIIDNYILIINNNTLKPLHNQGFYQSNFFAEIALRRAKAQLQANANLIYIINIYFPHLLIGFFHFSSKFFCIPKRSIFTRLT